MTHYTPQNTLRKRFDKMMRTGSKSKYIVAIVCMLCIILFAAACDGSPEEGAVREYHQTEPESSQNTSDASPGGSTEPAGDPNLPNSDVKESSGQEEASVSPDPEPDPSPVVIYPGPDVELFPYDGIVEHLFFHEVIAYPELAFDGDSMEKGYDDNMVTVSEYNKMLDSMYRNGYILVDLNDVWSEYVNDNGQLRMKKNTLMLPEGKKPLVLSYDDISFYEYMRNDGFMEKLIIGDDGEIWASGFDPKGNPVVSQDYTVVTILDKFIREHPDFSLGGVKGCIALTGYEGILGYRTQFDRNDTSEAFRLNRMQELVRVRPVVQRLKETGWYFATHSYGHISLTSSSLERVKTDAQRWLDEVGALVGETKIFIYPFGTRLDGDDVNKTGSAFRYYQELGFRIFASVGRESYSKIKTDISAVICDRMHADGISLRNERNRYMIFYDAAEVFDPARKEKYGKSW